MLEIGHIGAAFTLALFAFVIWRAWHMPAEAGLNLLGLAVLSVAVGFAFTLATGFVHGVCEGTLHLCRKTTDTTIWGIAYPLIAAPAIWLFAVVIFPFRPSLNKE
jgi:hypothetical protein